MITLKFLMNLLCFKKGETYTFNKGVNLVVGDQGTGKSTLLDCLGNYDEKKVSIKSTGLERTLFLDFEKDNPRLNSHYSNPLDLMLRFQSHGESAKHLFSFVDHEDNKDTIMILDEPDMALSIRSCYDLAKRLKKYHEEGRCIIMSAHNPIIISSMENVLSVEHKKWMTSKEFIESHMKPKKSNTKKKN